MPSEANPAVRGAFPTMGRFWTAANVLSLTRGALAVPIALLVYRGGPVGPLVGLVAFAIATDFLDGKLARWSRTVSEWGKVLDATADKLAAAGVTLALLTRPVEPNLPLWFVALAISRDLLLAGGGLLQTRWLGRFTTSLWSGKIAVGLLAVTILAALFRVSTTIMDSLVWATAAVMVVSVVDYGIRFRAIMRHGPTLHIDENGRVVFPDE